MVHFTHVLRRTVAFVFAATLAGSQTLARADDTSAPTPDQIRAQTFRSSLALQAATYCVPAVAMYNLRYSVSFAPTAKSKPNEIWKFDQIATPDVARQTGYVTPNVNVLYGFGFIDLGREPVIVTAPNSHGRYYVIQVVDMWTNDFAYVGGKTTGYDGGTFALVGPGWKGSLPAGVRRIDAPTRWVLVEPRVHVNDQADRSAASTVLNAITVTPLSAYEGKPQPSKVSYAYPVPNLEPNVASSFMRFKDPDQFWSICSATMNENPPPSSEIAAELPQFAYLGITFGKQWTPSSVDAFTLEQMRSAAKSIAPTMFSLAALSNKRNGWPVPFANQGSAGADYVSRALIAVLGLTANTPYEAIYYLGYVDGSGQLLNGAKRYTITFPPSASVIEPIPPGFWSLTAYDKETGFTVPNPIGRYALGGDNALSRNADGSFTIYVQRDDPGPDKESNWLPAPAGTFYLILRNYAPNNALVQGLKNPGTAAVPPPVVPVR
jgi:hypothetical protein